MNLIPIHKDKGERPRGKNPADGAAHADRAEFLLRVFHIREGDGVYDGNRRHIQQAMQQHQTQKGPESPGERQAEHRQSADEMAESEEFLRRKIAVAKLVTKKHADHGGDGKCVQNPGLLARRESEARQVAEDERQPSAPDEELQDHHQEQLESNVHKVWLLIETLTTRPVRTDLASASQMAKAVTPSRAVTTLGLTPRATQSTK